jgi:putative restriction endonuclease
VEPYVAVTNPVWFRHLRAQAGAGGALDEVNFWNPGGTPLKRFQPGDPVFFRLKAPDRRIGGYGFFAAFHPLRLAEAWAFFGTKNGCDDPFALAALTGKTLADRVGCTILRRVTCWPDARHFAWGDAEGWRGAGPQRGKTERVPALAQRLLDEIRFDAAQAPDELTAEAFVPLLADERQLVTARAMLREGQGAFRTRLLDAYGGRCAITGEHTEIVLDAAHIQPYLGPRSNHVQNGLLLTKEFHALFDAGYVTVTPEHEVRVSPRLRSEWRNGHRYYPHDGRQLLVLPDAPGERPSAEVLEWHGRRVFKN